MKLHAVRTIAALGLSAFAGLATAAPIVGTASLTGFFDTYSSSDGAIVADLNSIDVTSAALVGGTTGNFTPNGAATATDFTIVPVTPGLIYTFNGFTFTVQGITGITRNALTCNETGCTDDLTFDISGVVTKTGFDATAFTGTWTGNGSCQEGAPLGSPFTCAAGSKSGSWSVSLTAIGQPVAEPASLALVGLGLVGIGLARRRRTPKN